MERISVACPEEGIKVLGTPMRHPVFVAAHLERTTAEHQVLLDRIPHVPDRCPVRVAAPAPLCISSSKLLVAGGEP